MAGEDKLREYLKRVTVDLADARRRLAEADARRHEPIAVVGMACRFPGADTVGAFWELLAEARSAVLDDVPDGRYDLGPSVESCGVYTRRGAFLPDIAGWDAQFFGSPAREALRMDPQQRLLMELIWEALEDAGTPPPSLAGSRTGVMVGFSDPFQYGRLQADREGSHFFTDPYAGQGSSASVVAGRLAYHFDLRGPALTVDTACSSSLVAVHQAQEALRREECDLAVAAGAFLAIHPDMYVNACSTSMLSPDGLCKTFDAGADGYVMGEGGGVVVLERLSDALRAGHRIHAVIRGSAVNQDGRSNGLTAPNRGAQVEVIRRALSAAQTAPDEVSYVEAHGSGTKLGDAIELGALTDVFGRRSTQRPLHVGAVKTNIGHTQAAAGMAGLIKTVLVLKHGITPANLNMTHPSEAVLAAGDIRPVTATAPLPDDDQARVAGVSSFGWCGTNAHVVLEAAPAPAPTREQEEPHDGPTGPVALPVSAADADALRDRLNAVADALGQRALADVAFTLQNGRAELEYRHTVVAADAAQAAAGLREAAARAGIRRLKDGPRVAFLLPDSIEAYRGSGSGLYLSEPRFTAAVDECLELAGDYDGVDLRAGFASEAAPLDRGSLDAAKAERLHAFIVQYALGRLFTHLGVAPDRMIGRGVGTQAAACLSGRLTLEQALRTVAERDQTLAAAEGVSDENVDVWVVLGAESDFGRDGIGKMVLSALPQQQGGDRTHEVGFLLETFGRLWELGAAVDWAAIRGGAGQLTELPPYPFQRQRFWPASLDEAPAAGTVGARSQEPAEPAPAAEDHVRFMAQQWAESESADATGPISGRYVLIPDKQGVADALAERLRRDGGEVLDAATALNADDADDAEPLTIVDLAALDHAETHAEAAQAVLPASRTLASWGAAGRDARYLLVTRGGQAVGAGAPAIPAQAAAAVLPVVANQEYLNLDSRGIDLDPAYTAAESADALLRELRAGSDSVLVAYRADRRHVPGYAPVDIAAEPEIAPAVNAGGTYLITGGLGEIGLIVAEHLIRQGAAGVVLTSRSGVGDDPADPRRAAVDRLRLLGADVRTPRVDVTDAAAMRELFTTQRIDGVVHSAMDGAADTFRPLRDLDEATVARHFGAKVTGAAALRDVLATLPADQAPRWCVVFSSTSALLGGVTFGSYAAANAALTAVADGATGTTRWISAAWDTWACTLVRLGSGIGATMAKHSMSDAEALNAFDLLAARAHSPIVVAAGGLEERLPRARTGGAQPTRTASIRFPRPDLPQPYAPPLTATERALVEVWEEVLAVEPVGTRDNFFDLRGNSLLVPQLVALIGTRFGVTLPTVTLFEAPTVRGLSAVIDRETAPPAQEPATATVEREVSRAASAQVAASRTARAQTAPPQTVLPQTVPTKTVPAIIEPALNDVVRAENDADRRIAIIGMAGRFPGASDVATFWRNLCDGVESITFFSEQELLDAGVEPGLVRDPAYVPARPVLDDVTGFDAGFFGISPRMAALTDPQQRLFLEVCWEALEQGGYGRPENRGRVGVFGGAHISTYLLGIRDRLGADVSQFEIAMGNEKDALTTTVSYLFDLHGPSVAVQTFCSTSLVATHLAVQSLRTGQCEMALAGGVSIRIPDKTGHRYEEGGMESPDGHVRTFDAKARGAMFGDGATVVLLKRLSDALRDGDHVWGVIRGSAMNNDGGLKVGYTAPSLVGQARVIADAMADAGVHAQDVGYVEAHGSGTRLGDPIEVAALTRAFGPTETRGYCPIGSVKTNVGHLDRAAGGAGLIKATMALREQLIPATLHFTEPNPEIDFANSPFYVNAELAAWPAPDGRPRIAGVNSLGMGGTNVHVVVEEPPLRPALPPADPDSARRYHVLPVSARSAAAADEACRRLGEHLDAHPDTGLADAAFTLQVGRKTFEHRRVAVASSLDAAAATLTGTDGTGPSARMEPAQGRPVAFLLAGVGEQYPGLAGELYRREPVFRAALDECLTRLAGAMPDADEPGGVDLAGLLTGPRGGGTDLAALLGRGGGGTDARAAALQRTEVVQPLMFAVDYAMARTLMAWGLRPKTMLGYSLGEYVAACLAGVLTLDDALALVVHRAKLIGGIAPGAMAAVSMGADELAERFGLEARGLDLAAVNGPQAVVVAGAPGAVEELLAELRRAEIPCRPLQTTHAFHSRMLAPLREELTAWIAANVTLNPPALPYLSNVTGRPADATLVCDPAYWARHMCETVQFATGTSALLADPELAVVEIGPGQSLGALTRAAGCPPQRWPLITATLPGSGDPRPADAVLADCLARLWLVGVDIDWAAYHGRGGDPAVQQVDRAPGRIPLPTYPFQRQRYWIEPAAPKPGLAVGSLEGGDPPGGDAAADPSVLTDISRIPRLPETQWLNLPVWRQTARPAPAAAQPASWLVYVHGDAAEAVLSELRRAAAPTGATVTAVRPGAAYRRTQDGWLVRPGDVDDALDMLRELRESGERLERVVHLWALDEDADGIGPVPLGLHTLVALSRAAGELGLDDWALDIVAAGVHPVLDGGEVRPDASMLVGPALVIPLEYPSVAVRLIDVEQRTAPAAIVAELRRPPTDRTVAIRGARRWVREFEAVEAQSPGGDDERPDTGIAVGTNTGTDTDSAPRDGGVYLITGGLGGIGLAMAENLAREHRAKLVLFGRTGLPPRERWADIASGAQAADEHIRTRVARLVEIIGLGAQVEVVSGDVAEPADVRRAVDLARERFGALHGVLHAAGVPGIGLIQFKRPEDCDLVLAPKVAGSQALAEALRIGEPDEIPLDFLVLFSSITSATGGGPGQVDYCAANAYLDAYAARLAASGRRVLSVGWGEWTWNAWDEGLSGYDDTLQTFFREHRAAFGISFEEGWRTLVRALASGEPHVVASTQDLPAVLRLSTGFTVEAAAAPAAAGTAMARHPRPDLVTPYQEPSGATEEGIAAIWCETLRLEKVGAADNFFELGGNSLLGIGLLGTLRRLFAGAELPPHILHEAPTVAALARIVDGAGAAGASRAADDAQAQASLRRSGLKAAAARRRRP